MLAVKIPLCSFGIVPMVCFVRSAAENRICPHENESSYYYRNYDNYYPNMAAGIHRLCWCCLTNVRSTVTTWKVSAMVSSYCSSVFTTNCKSSSITQFTKASSLRLVNELDSIGRITLFKLLQFLKAQIPIPFLRFLGKVILSKLVQPEKTLSPIH